MAVKATVNWIFETTPGRVKVVDVSPGGSVGVIADFTASTLSGSNTYTVANGGASRTIRVEAMAYGASCGYAYDVASHVCGCDVSGRSVGDPVDVIDGNMRYDDADPLPSPGGPALTRAYDSRSSIAGRFGVGWSSIFDSVARPKLPESVLIITGSNAPYVFQAAGAANGTFSQLWPRSANQAVLVSGTGTYQFRSAGDTRVWIYSATTSRLLEVRDERTNRSTYFSYDGSGNPTAVTDSWGAWSWTIGTNTAGRITSISVDGNPALLWTYAYDLQGHLTDVVGPGTSQWRQYEYTSGLLTAARDGAGKLIESHDYDLSGRAITSHGPSDEITSVDYADSGTTSTEWITRVTRATGSVMEIKAQRVGGTWRTTEIVGSCLSCGSSADVTNTYDSYGLLSRIQDAAGYITTNTYDPSHRLVSTTSAQRPSGCDPEIDAGRCRLSSSALAAATLVTTSATTTREFTYSDANWPERATLISTPSVVAIGQAVQESIAYHAISGTVVSKAIHGYTDLTTTQDRMATNDYYGDGGDPTTPMFDPGGVFISSWLSLPQPARLIRSSDGPRTDVSDVTAYVYYPIDASVPVLLRGHIAAIRNPLGHITRFESYDIHGNVTRVVDPNGVATERTYDQYGRPLTTTVKGVFGCDSGADPLCSTDLITTRTYSGAGPLLSEQMPSGAVTVYGYDSRGRVQTTSRGPSVSDLRERLETTYDAGTGKKTLERVLAYEAGSWVAKRTEAFSYDDDGRLQTNTHADNYAIHYGYDGAGRLATIQDERHSTPNTFYSYDPAGRMRSVKQTLSSVTGGFVTTAYVYDSHGNLTQVTDPNDNVTTYSFTDFGEMVTQQSPVTGTTTYSYDVTGNLISTTDANLATTTRTYDALGRALTAVSSRSNRTTETVQWQYDDAAAGRFGIGHLTLMTDPTGTTNYYYDRMARTRREEKVLDVITYATTFQYDVDGNVTQVGYPSGLVVDYTNDFAGRPLTAATAATAIVTSAAYLPFGPVKQLVFGNGTTQTLTYDARYRIEENTLSSSSTIADYQYAYDGAGNITAIHDLTDNGFNRDFAYDDLNRLVTANSGLSLWGTGSYSYDAMGNMLSQTLGPTVETWSYAGTTPKVSTMSYDAAGNETGDQSISARNLVDNFGESCLSCGASYAYDGRGIRVATGYNVSVTHHIYSPQLQALGQYRDIDGDAAPDQSMEFVWFGGRPVAQIDWEGTKYTFADHLGSPILQTNSTGQIIWRLEFTPYGATYADRANGEILLLDYEPQPLRFPGQEATLFNTYNLFRWYRAGSGRYTQADPIGLKGGINHYSYSEHNPTNNIDPLGLVTVQDDIIDHYYGRVKDWVTACAQIGPAGGECGNVGADAECKCESEGGCWRARATLIRSGDIHVYNGPFRDLPVQPSDPHIRNTVDAITHAYRTHVVPATQQAVAILARLEALSFQSEQECQDNCAARVRDAIEAFSRKIKETMVLERRLARRR